MAYGSKDLTAAVPTKFTRGVVFSGIPAGPNPKYTGAEGDTFGDQPDGA